MIMTQAYISLLPDRQGRREKGVRGMMGQSIDRTWFAGR